MTTKIERADLERRGRHHTATTEAVRAMVAQGTLCDVPHCGARASTLMGGATSTVMHLCDTHAADARIDRQVRRQRDRLRRR